MPRAKEGSYQAAVRFPESWVGRLEALGKRLSPLVPLPLAAVLRAVLERGLTSLEAEHGLTGSTESPPTEATKQKGESRPSRKPKPSK
jgi:hypothetical protein